MAGSAPENALAPPGLRVCILSRKSLGRITRVVRQAKALSEAGHEVTVVTMGKPVDELVALTPEVQYLEVEVEPWTRAYVLQKKAREEQRSKSRMERDARRSRVLAPLVTVGRRIAGTLRLVFVVVPLALLTKLTGQSVQERVRELRPLAGFQLNANVVHPFSQHGYTTSFAREASAALSDCPLDICQAHDNYALLAAERVAREHGALLVYDAVEIAEHRLAIQTSLLSRLASRYERRRERRIIRRADAVVTVGDGLADWYTRRYRIPRPLVVRNCRYYTEYVRREDIRWDCGVLSEPLVVWFGYAYPDQGLETIIEAARYVGNNVHFALISDVAPRWQPFFEDLRARVESLGLANRIHFLRPRDPNDLISYVSGGDIGIIPRPTTSLNTYLSMPNKFMEMVMARLPIAISDLADMRALIERYEIGAIFDVEDPQDVARVLTEMLEARTYARLHAGVWEAAKELTWENESRKYVELYTALARERGTPGTTPPRVAASTREPERKHARTV